MKIIPFLIAEQLCDKICHFLLAMGGAYHKLTGEMQENILVCLASRQFVIRIDGKGYIQYFACWFKIHPDDVEGMKERVRPYDVYTGSVMYVVEAGNKLGKRGMVEMVKKIRAKAEGMKGVFWHRPTKQDKVFDFPSQKGA
jgi:hemolysin-activating ACP:hemolysin acyltransferase